jgi:DNA-binding NarL/FixJ family response regulator
VNQEIAIVVLTIHDDREYLSKMLALGASGFIPKRSAPEALPIAIRAVAQGEMYIHPTIDNADGEHRFMGEESNPSR